VDPAKAPRRRPLLILLGVCAAALLPWIAYLLVELPDEHASRQWRTTWVGFDLALVVAFATAAWLGWRRRRAVGAVLIMTATLLVCDAWFDVTLSWGYADWWHSVLMAGCVEVPLAALLVHRGWRIATRMPPRAAQAAEVSSPAPVRADCAPAEHRQ
jgi:hypothetical protein